MTAPKLPDGWELEVPPSPPRVPEGWELDDSTPIEESSAIVDPGSRTGAAVTKYGEGASLGFADELRGASGALQELASRGPLGRIAALAVPAAALPLAGPAAIASSASAPQLLTGSSRELASFPDAPLLDALVARYRQDRDSQRARQDEALRAHPTISRAAQLAGALSVPLPKAAPLTTVVGRSLQGAGLGVALGGGAALGESRADTAPELLRDTGKGAALGGAIGGVVPVAGEVVSQRVLKPAAERFANTQAVKALLGGGELVNRLRDRLGVRSESGMQSLGRDVRDAGLLGRVVPRNVQGINEANRRALDAAGGEIGDVVAAADDVVAREMAAAKAAGLPSFSRPETWAAADAFRKGVVREAQRTGTAMQLAPEVAQSATALEEPGVSTFRQLWDTKASLGKQAFPLNVSRVGERQQLMQAGQQAAARNIEQQLEQRVGPDAAAKLRSAMDRYSLGKRIEDTVSNAATRAEGRSMGPSLRDLQAMETLGASGPAGGLGAMGLQFLRGRGNAAAALYAPRAAGALGSAARVAAPALAREVGASVAQRGLDEQESEAIDAFLSNSP